MTKKVNQNHENCKWIVSNFVKKENIDWPREIKMAQKLTREYSCDIDFWENLSKQFKIKLPSLAYFLTENGKELLIKEKNKENLVLPDKVYYDIGTETNNKLVERTKKSKLLEFLN